MEIGLKKICEIGLFDFTGFFGLDFLKVSGPLWVCRLDVSKNLVVIVPILYHARLWGWIPDGHNLEQQILNWFSSYWGYWARPRWFSLFSHQPAPKYISFVLSKDILSGSGYYFGVWTLTYMDRGKLKSKLLNFLRHLI